MSKKEGSLGTSLDSDFHQLGEKERQKGDAYGPMYRLFPATGAVQTVRFTTICCWRVLRMLSLGRMPVKLLKG
jgi:hypothetical protein